MRSFFALLSVIVSTCCVHGFAQQAPKTQAILASFAEPVYPPLARQANIHGTVSVIVAIHSDGTSAVALESGHPMLTQAALDSAKRTRFECRRCDADVPYRLVYSFRLVRGNDCCSAMSVPAKITLEQESSDQDGRPQTEISIAAEEICICDPAAQVVKKRSVKCLYLWRCS
jgi:TonB family protein